MSGHIWTRLSISSALWCSVAVIVANCDGSGTSVTDCPSYIVVPDGGATGFSSVGEWRTDAVCAQYCQADFPVCQLATATSVKCQKGCQ
jgi:predicted amidohydrolase